MTTRQQAQELLAQIPENQLAQAIKFMTDLLNKKESKTYSTLPYVNPQEILKELDALREELSKYPIEDLDTAREAALAEKYGQYM